MAIFGASPTQSAFRRLLALTVAGLVIVVRAAGADAAELQKIGEIAVPGDKLMSFDIGFVDQKTQRYVLADRSNKAVDIFDARTKTYVGRIPGFVGAVPRPDGSCCNNAKSGPNGVLIIDNEIWAGDGDSTVKVIDINAMNIVDTISTGGQLRANEMTYAPEERIVIIGNQNDRPPFTTFISTQPGHKIIGKVTTPEATDGNEQPMYNPAEASSISPFPCLTMSQQREGSPYLIQRKPLS
jgi:hypothetical protein